jgi:hypothetical protein
MVIFFCLRSVLYFYFCAGIYGSFYASSSFGGIPGLSTPPVAYLSEFDYTSSWSGALDPISANVSAAASYIVSEYQSLEMFDANNVSMGVTFLADLRWSTPGGVETSASGDLSWVTFVGTKRNDPLVVSTYLHNPNSFITPTVIG